MVFYRYGMLLLVKPSYCPLYGRSKSWKGTEKSWIEFIYSKVTARAMPQLCDNFDLYKAASWNNILAAGKASVKFDSKSRASVKELQEIILRGKIYRNYPLAIHQGSGLENAAFYRSGTYCLVYVDTKCFFQKTSVPLFLCSSTGQ